MLSKSGFLVFVLKKADVQGPLKRFDMEIER